MDGVIQNQIGFQVLLVIGIMVIAYDALQELGLQKEQLMGL